MTDKILLQNMMFYAYHGVFDYEREHGQRFYLDIEIDTDTKEAGESDDLNRAVDYTTVYKKVKDIVENQRYMLLESLAKHISDELLEFDRIDSVTVRIRKPAVPIPGQIDYVQLEITRRC